MDVESFWRSCSPEQRMQLLQVPLAPLLEGEWSAQLLGSCGPLNLLYVLETTSSFGFWFWFQWLWRVL
jgi:hypothetical protein